jgi:hypothetical protein
LFEQVTQKQSRWRIFWPEVTDLDGAKEAIRLGYGACFVLAALNAIVAAFGATASVVDAIVFGILGLLLRRKSRTAAVVAVALMALTIIISFLRVPFVGVLTIILFVCLVSSVRGTFAYWKLVRAGAGSAREDASRGIAV